MKGLSYFAKIRIEQALEQTASDPDNPHKHVRTTIPWEDKTYRVVVYLRRDREIAEEAKQK